MRERIRHSSDPDRQPANLRANVLRGTASAAAMAVGLGLLSGREAWAVCTPDGTGAADTIVCNTTAPNPDGDGVDGGLGDDIITVQSGATVGSGSGSDFIAGGEGADSIVIQAGGVAGAGTGTDDDVTGDIANPTATQNQGGSDTIRVFGTAQDDVQGGVGDDILEVNGGLVGQDLDGDIADPNGGDTVVFDGSDEITVTNGTIGRDVLGRGGADTITITNSSVSRNLNSGTDADEVELDGSTLGQDLLTSSGVDTITITNSTVGRRVDAGGDGDLIILDGAVIAEDIRAGGGSDTITVLGGGATVTGNVDFGGSNDDVQLNAAGYSIGGSLLGGGGSDTMTLVGGIVSGNVEGGGGFDSIVLDDLNGGDTVALTIGGDIIGGVGADVIVLVSGAFGGVNVIGDANGTGGTGDRDSIHLGGATVGAINAEFGNDTLTFTSGGVIGGVTGGDGDDFINFGGGTTGGAVTGGDGNDSVNMLAGTVGGNLLGGNDSDTVNLVGGVVTGNVLAGAGSDTIFLRETMNFSDVLGGEIGGGGGTDFLQVEVVDSASRTFDGGQFTSLENVLIRNDTDPGARGTLILAPTTASPVFTGTTFQVSGAATVDFVNASGDNMIDAGTVTFDEGTMLTGEGTITSSVTDMFGTFFNGGVSPGNSPGIIVNAGDATFGAGSFFLAEFDDTDASLDIEPGARGTEFDGMDITAGGDLNITAGAYLVVDFIDEAASLLTGLVDGNQFEIFQLTGGGTITGDFNLIVTPDSLIAGLQWRTFTSGSVFGIELFEDVPEPATSAGLGVALAGLFGLRRRRLKRNSKATI